MSDYTSLKEDLSQLAESLLVNPGATQVHHEQALWVASAIEGDRPDLQALSLSLTQELSSAKPRVERAAELVAALQAALEPAEPAPSAPKGGWRPPDADTCEIVREFCEEALDGLDQAEAILARIEHEPATAEDLNCLFRVFHTIKGVAGFLALDEIGHLAHATESLLAAVRDGALPRLERAAVGLLLEVAAIQRTTIESLRHVIASEDPLPPIRDLETFVARLEETRLHGQAALATAPGATPTAPSAPTAAPLDAAPPRPVAPPTPALDPTPSRVAPVVTPQPAAAVVAPPSGPPPAPVPIMSAAEPVGPDDGQDDDGRARASQKAGTKDVRETMKVDLERVDRFVEMIGELVILEAMVSHEPEIRMLQSKRVSQHLTQLTKISRDLQDLAMRMRMVPVRGLFQKAGRMLRELSRGTGKPVRLEVAGEATEMDRSMVEQLGDPLVHMIRNSIDHGLEVPAERAGSGKPAEGRIMLSAVHEGGNLVLTVEDDGRGLDPDRILAKARERGMVRPEAKLSMDEIYQIILQPGFSTAPKVTALSGRGVGMDVVRKNIESMRGRIEIRSTRGKGTQFRLILPLTLSIIDGTQVRVGSERFIIPTLSVVETLRPSADVLSTYAGAQELITLRGRVVPVVRLSSLFSCPGAVEDPTKGLIVIVQGVGTTFGMLVDDVVAQQQVVIKSLGSRLVRSPIFSGAAVLSDGRVGLIVDTEALASRITRRRAIAESEREELVA